MIDRILVPLDGSAVAECAVPHAAALARAFDADVCLFRILPPGRAGGLSRDSVETRLQRREAEGYLEGLAGRLRSLRVATTVAVGEGSASEEILRWVTEHDVDLIVAGAWGRGGSKEYDMGGMAWKLVAGAATSIMLVRPELAGVGEGPAEYRRVLVPVDGSRRCDWALCLAGSVAAAQGAELLIVHVVSVPASPARLPAQPDEEALRRELVEASRASARRYLEEMRHRLTTPGLTVRARVVVDTRVSDAVLRTAREEQAGLVVLGAHGESGDVRRPYGSVAGSLISYCELPLLVLQDLPVAAGRRDRTDELNSLTAAAANAAAE